MGFFLRIIAKIAANIGGLWIAATFIAGFTFVGGLQNYLIGGVVLALVNFVLRPILKIISFPFLLITLGLFSIIIYIILLLVADYLLPQLTIAGFLPLLWTALLFHLRVARLVGPLGLAVGSVLGIVVVMWAWFGVNLLSIGLHSYGFTSGLATNLLIYLACQVLFLFWAIPLAKKRLSN